MWRSISSFSRATAASLAAASPCSDSTERRRASTWASCWKARACASVASRRDSAARAACEAPSFSASVWARAASICATPPMALSSRSRRSLSRANSTDAAASRVRNWAASLAAAAAARSRPAACSSDAISFFSEATRGTMARRCVVSSARRIFSGAASSSISRSPAFTSWPSTSVLTATLLGTRAATACADCCTSSRAWRDTSYSVTRPKKNQANQAASSRPATSQASSGRRPPSCVSDLVVRAKRVAMD